MEPPETETSLLPRRWHEGDREALDALLVHHLPAIREQVEWRLGVQLRAKESVSDIAQDTEMEVLRHGPKFQVSDARHFRPLMVRIFENVFRDKNKWCRARRRDRTRECPLPSDSVVELDRPVRRRMPLEEEADSHEREAFVRMGLELLEAERRELLVLRMWDDLSFAAIGQRLRVSEEAARKRCRRAMIHLQRSVRELRRGSVVALFDHEGAEN